MRPRPRTVVALASADRPALLEQAIACCVAQEGISFDLLLSVPDESSLPAEKVALGPSQVVTGARGLAAQRNTALLAVPDADVVAFFDDDALMRSDYLAIAVQFLEDHPDVVGLTGRVLLDGAVSGEIPVSTAEAALSRSATEPRLGTWRPADALYGCNFVVRGPQARKLLFDERLPLYSWLEDLDFARRLTALGPLAKVDDCVVVHRAAASGGRRSHLRLGYSQVMNPIYLRQKGSFSGRLALQQLFRPVAKNLLLAVAGRQSSWRRIRLRGNLLALADAVRRRITPERIVDLG